MLGLGAGLMYFLDPDRGRRRRALVRDQIDHTIHELDSAIQLTARDLNNRLQGLVHEVQGPSTAEEVSDRVLEERVRSRMGRFVSHPRAITVTARDGHVTLQGPILTGEAERLFDAALATPGVRSVDNQLELHDEPGNIPALQGGKTRTGTRPELLQQTWSPTTRLLVGTAAAGLLWKMAGRRSMIRPLLALGGAGLVARALMLNAHTEGRQEYPYSYDPAAGGTGWNPAYDESYPPTPVI